MIQSMTLAERIGQLNLVNPGDQPLTGSVANVDVRRSVTEGRVGMMFGIGSIERRREIQNLCVRETRLGIPMLFASDVIHGYRTALPLPIAMACTWNLELIERSAHLAATEARADGIDLTFAPMVDVTRDPRWGRLAEGAGESPVLGAMIAAAMVRGFQGSVDGSQLTGADRMLACVKHFVGYGAGDGGREYAAANLGPHELHETHLPPFLAAIDAGVAAVMPGFNTIDRVPVTADARLLTTLLRDQWKFAGAVISDYTAINELQSHGMGDLAAVSARAINAGVDVDMVGQGFVSTLERSVEAGLVDESTIDRACRAVLRMKFMAGLFDDPFRSLDVERAAKVIGCDSHRKEAREMASQSFVLLRNQNGVLPLPTTGRIALIGPLADDRTNLPGTWSFSARGEDCISLLEGLREVGGDRITIETACGCNLVDDPVMARRLNLFGETVTINDRTSDDMIAEAIEVATRCDTVVMAIGEAKEHSGECSSRTDLNLSDGQRELIAALRTTGKPIVLVIFAGRPLVLTDIVDQVDAILYVWYGGSLAGPAIADVLLGRREPTGRLTMSFPRSVGQIPVHHDQLPTGRPLPPNTTFEKFKSCYLDEINDPLFVFGFGLTYTEFVFDPPTIDRSVIDAAETAKVSITVRNVGRRDGVAVVQLYWNDSVAEVSRPRWQLQTFERINIERGGSRTVTFSVRAEDFAYVRANSIADVKWQWDAGEIILGVGSSVEKLTNVTLRLVRAPQ